MPTLPLLTPMSGRINRRQFAVRAGRSVLVGLVLVFLPHLYIAAVMAINPLPPLSPPQPVQLNMTPGAPNPALIVPLWGVQAAPPVGEPRKTFAMISQSIVTGFGCNPAYIEFFVVSLGIVLLFMWPVRLMVPRLHDIGLTGRWALMPAPFLLSLILAWADFASCAHLCGPCQPSAFGITAWAAVPLPFIFVAMCLWLALAPGKPGPNRYGPPP
jgi:uncharacterized membrane protein YhaH (DUF805 family)